VKVALQHCDTKLYVQNTSEWTDDVNTALDFHRCLNAVKFAVVHGLTRMQLVLTFSRRRYNVILPLSDNQHTLGREQPVHNGRRETPVP
jgi:hypothetical protein